MILSKVIIRDIKSVLAELNSSQKLGSAYAHHQALWLLFPEIPEIEPSERPFLFQHTPQIHPQGFLVLSHELPVAHPSFQIESKPYDPQLKKGDALHFSLRANPVVTRKDPSSMRINGDPRKKRNDVVADWKHHFKKNWEGDHPNQQFPGFPDLGYSQADIVTTQCTQWLENRSEKHGFELQQCLVESYHQQSFYKKGQNNGVKISVVDFSGTLKVTDLDAFRQILFKGLGPAKGFGCGLFLIRKVLK